MKKINHLLVFVMLILGLIQITVPLNNINTSASIPPPPDDGVNGAYVQYIEGYWSVDDTQSYTDEIIVLNGSLSIQSGGSLTLKNVTLAINCTSVDGQYMIVVMSGGSLIITDGDNDPKTTQDASNITDSPFDTDNDTKDYDFEYTFRVYNGGFFSLNNSLVRECGYQRNYYTNGICTETNNVKIENCTFESNYYGIYTYSGNNFEIKNNTFTNNYVGYSSGYSAVNGLVRDNLFHLNNIGMYAGGYDVIVTNNTAHNNSYLGLGIQSANDLNFFNNTMVYNGGTSWTHNLFIGFSDSVEVHNNTIQYLKAGGYHTVMIRDTGNLYFHDNIVTHNDDQAIRCDINSNSDTNIRFIHNNISNNDGSGLTVYGRYNTANYVEVKDNMFYQNQGYGYHFAKLLAYTVTNNTIISTSSGVFIDATQYGDFSNNTINIPDSSTSFYIRDTYGANDDTNFEVINCTFNASKVWLTQGYATLIISNFLHVKVIDNNGPAPNVTVKIASTVISSFNFTRLTDSSGYVMYVPIRNQTQTNTVSGTAYQYYDPYNITATSYAYTAYGAIEPTMDKPQTVLVYFNADLPPEQPTKLTANSNGTNVDLEWAPCKSPDLNHYLIYRNGSGAAWSEVYNSTMDPPTQTWTNWTDINGAQNMSTYRYKVLAVDAADQNSEYSNIAKCGDWVIPDTTICSDLTFQLNGSLIILPTGNLTLKNVEIKFNNTKTAEYGLEVKPGGELYILDNDNNPLTTSDQSHITALDTTKNFYFIMNGSEFTMKNSKLSYCGSNKDLDSITWFINYAPYVIDYDLRWLRGLYLSADTKALIESNEFSNNFVSVLLDGNNNCSISYNTFSNNEFGIYLNNAEENILNDNTFTNHNGFPIFLYNSGSNSIISNEITYPVANDGAIGINGYSCNDNVLFENTFEGGLRGIYFYYAGNNNNISNNFFDSTVYGINIRSTDWSILSNNIFINTETSCYITRSDETTIENCATNWTEVGYRIDDSSFCKISNVSVENASSSASWLTWSDEVMINNLSARSCLIGINVQGSSEIALNNLSIVNCTLGIVTISGSDNIFLRNTNINSDTDEAILSMSGNNIFIINCTFNALNYNFNLTDSEVILLNTTYDQSNVLIDKSSKLSLLWFLHAQVIDWYGNPAYNVNLQIRKVMGTFAFNGYTDSNGWVRWLILLERSQYFQSNDTVTPYYLNAISGNHSGSDTLLLNRSTHLIIKLENIQPEVANVVISPSDPTTISKLSLSYQYSDDEDDPSANTKISWYTDGTHNSTFDNETTIDSQYTKKGQTWFCEIKPHDGALFGIPMTSNPVTIQNTPPVASNVKIDETNPTSSEDLHVSYSYLDIDNDPETRSSHRWYVDHGTGTGWEYSEHDAMTLSADYTKKGERWYCEVTPGDGDEDGNTKDSGIVTIYNTKPQVTEVNIEPNNPMSNQTLRAKYCFFDIDSDEDVGSIIQWFKNDEEQVDLNGSQSIDAALTNKGEEWYYIIYPRDGVNFGIAQKSTTVIIGNTAPEVGNIIIYPQYPSTTDDLSVIYEFKDNDDDSEGKDTIIEWYRKRPGDIEFTRTGLKVSTLSSIYTSKNEVWTCEVTPHDGLDYGTNKTCSVSVKILNSKPTITNAHITPENPNTETKLRAQYEYYDLDNDLEQNSELIWYRDNVSVVEFKNQLTVPNSATLKDQVWYFTIRPKDDEEFGEIVTSENIVINNSAPTSTDLILTPMFPLGDDDLIASYIFSDSDNGNESIPEIRWYENGLLQTQYNDKLEVESKATEKGDIWYFTLRVFDGIDYSEMYTSHYVTIGNSMAIITKLAPSIGKIILNETEDEHFNIEALDPGGDFLLYKWKLNDISVSSEDNFKFTTDYKSAGEYNLTLSIQDVDKQSKSLSLEWGITVLNLNRPPTLVVIEPIANNSIVKVDKSLKFAITTDDPDSDDVLTIKWYFDNIEITGQSGSSYAYVGKEADLGEHTVKAIVFDGEDEDALSVEYSWKVTVQSAEKLDLGGESDEKFYGYSYDWWGFIGMVISGIFAVLMFLFGLLKVRQKKSRLKEYMTKIEDILDNKKSPKEKETELLELKKEIKKEFARGLITENHYIILERMADDAIGQTRTSILEDKVAMPKDLKEDVEEVLADGVVTKDEYRTIVDRIRTTEDLSEGEKLKLNSLLSRWMMENKKDNLNSPPVHVREIEKED